MSVASHLGVSPAGYDRRIRQLILHYDELVAEAAGALRYARRPVRAIVDLGIGTGMLSAACLARAPRARVHGIDADRSMLDVARVRLKHARSRLTLTEGDFTAVRLPAARADAIVASYALHHIRSRRAKLAFYRRCRRALRRGGVLISGDCAPASSPAAAALDLRPWYLHLAKSIGSIAAARRVYESWADEDTYVPLGVEVDLLERAGFSVEIPWRQAPFAVLVGLVRDR